MSPGPSPDAQAPHLESEALEYTRWLATHHYENFHVASFLLPKRLHQDFYNVYAFCRWADDLGDEIGDPQESLRLLAWWRNELQAMYSGAASHPVFVALRLTVARHSIPIEPFDRLIRAFEQDQIVTAIKPSTTFSIIASILRILSAILFSISVGIVIPSANGSRTIPAPLSSSRTSGKI